MGLLSMPTGKVFSAMALEEAVRVHLNRSFDAIVAVGDCVPAARAMSCRNSRSPQMRRLVGASVRSAPRWLGVHVPREWNLDADALSHPSRFGEVSQRIRLVGWVVCRLEPTSEMCSLLEEVVTLPLGRDDEGWRRRCKCRPIMSVVAHGRFWWRDWASR